MANLKSHNMKRIKRFGVFQTAKVVAINMFFISLLLMIPFSMITNFMVGNKLMGFHFGGGLFFFLLPVFYGVMGFIGTGLACLIYNFIAEWTGGIEVEFETGEEEGKDEETGEEEIISEE
jgi:hypothetical protein